MWKSWGGIIVNGGAQEVPRPRPKVPPGKRVLAAGLPAASRGFSPHLIFLSFCHSVWKSWTFVQNSRYINCFLLAFWNQILKIIFFNENSKNAETEIMFFKNVFFLSLFCCKLLKNKTLIQICIAHQCHQWLDEI